MAKYKVVGPETDGESFDWNKIIAVIMLIIVAVIFIKIFCGGKEGFAVSDNNDESCSYYELDNNNVNTSFVNNFQSYFN